MRNQELTDTVVETRPPRCQYSAAVHEDVFDALVARGWPASVCVAAAVGARDGVRTALGLAGVRQWRR